MGELLAIAEPLARALRRDGHEVETIGDGLVASARCVSGEHDMVILDLGLPSLDGVEMCRRIRAHLPDAYVPDGTLCSDGNACTSPDSCTAGVCGGPAVSCDDGNPCTTDSCGAGGCALQRA